MRSVHNQADVLLDLAGTVHKQNVVYYVEVITVSVETRGLTAKAVHNRDVLNGSPGYKCKLMPVRCLEDCRPVMTIVRADPNRSAVTVDLCYTASSRNAVSIINVTNRSPLEYILAACGIGNNSGDWTGCPVPLGRSTIFLQSSSSSSL